MAEWSQGGNVECTPQSCGRPEPEAEAEAQGEYNPATLRRLCEQFDVQGAYSLATPGLDSSDDSQAGCPVADQSAVDHFGPSLTNEPMYCKLYDYTGVDVIQPERPAIRTPEHVEVSLCERMSLFCSMNVPCSCRSCCPNTYAYLEERRWPRGGPGGAFYWDGQDPDEDRRAAVLHQPARDPPTYYVDEDFNVIPLAPGQQAPIPFRNYCSRIVNLTKTTSDDDDCCNVQEFGPE